MLIKSFNKHVLKQIATPQLADAQIVSHIALFEILAHQVGETLVIEVASGDIESRLITLLQSKTVTMEQRYILFKFISRCKCTTDLLVKHLLSNKDAKKSA